MERGKKKVDKVEFRDGTVVDIRLDKSKSTFLAEMPDDMTTLVETDLNELKRKVREWFEDLLKNDFEPVIVLQGTNWMNSGTVNFSFERYFRASRSATEGKRPRVMWRNWVGKAEDPEGITFGRYTPQERHEVELGKPGRFVYDPSGGSPAVVIPYTANRWQKLLKLEEILERLKTEIDKMCGDEDTAMKTIDMAEVLFLPGALDGE